MRQKFCLDVWDWYLHNAAQTTMLTLSKSLGWFDAWQYYRRELRNPIVNLVPIGSSWHGQLARHWGLDKAVPTEDTFANVAAGRDPCAGRVLVDDRMSFACIKNDSQIPRAIAHRAGWDATISAPTSVSVTAVVGPDLRIRDAHRASVQTCLDECERFTQARIGGNHPPETTGRWIAALFEHDCAPPAEDGYAAPHLHTHVVVFNITMLSTGEARPVKSPDLLTQEYGDAVYLSELAHRLYRLRYELDVDARGQFEIRGYTPEYLAACRPEGVLLRRRAADSPKRLRGTD